MKAKTLNRCTAFHSWKALSPVLFSIFLCGLDSAPAQSLGECAEQVLSAPTESSVKVRLVGVNQWPTNPICFWTASGVGPGGEPFGWSATLIGDGLVNSPPLGPYVNVTLNFGYSGNEGSASLVRDFFCPYPSQGFELLVDESNAEDTTDGVPPFPLSVKGTIRLDAANNLVVDVTFTGGTPSQPSISDLIALLNNSSLSTRLKRSLLPPLQAARAALDRGHCEAAIRRLEVFQHKVRVQVRRSDQALRQELIATAQTIIDSACSDSRHKRVGRSVGTRQK